MNHKVILLGDTHFSCRNGNPKLHEFFDKCYLDIFFPYCLKNNIKTIIQLGDLWDSRKGIPTLSIYEARRYFFDRLKSHGMELITLLGNHDILYRNTVEYNSTKVLLEGYDNIKIIDKPEEIVIGKSKFLLVPWICDDNKESIEQSIKSTDAKYLIGHFEFSGFEMFTGQMSHGGQELTDLDKFDTVFSGHYHHRSKKGNILYVGIFCEHSWMDANDPKGFHILDCDTGKLEFIRNPYVLHQTIYYDESNILEDLSQFKRCFIKLIVKNKTNQIKFENFLDNLSLIGVHEIKIIDEAFSELTNTDYTVDIEDEDTITLIDRYIDTVDIPSKDNIKTYFKQLYIESIQCQE